MLSLLLSCTTNKEKQAQKDIAKQEIECANHCNKLGRALDSFAQSAILLSAESPHFDSTMVDNEYEQECHH